MFTRAGIARHNKQFCCSSFLIVPHTFSSIGCTYRTSFCFYCLQNPPISPRTRHESWVDKLNTPPRRVSPQSWTHTNTADASAQCSSIAGEQREPRASTMKAMSRRHLTRKRELQKATRPRRFCLLAHPARGRAPGRWIRSLRVCTRNDVLQTFALDPSC